MVQPDFRKDSYYEKIRLDQCRFTAMNGKLLSIKKGKLNFPFLLLEPGCPDRLLRADCLCRAYGGARTAISAFIRIDHINRVAHRYGTARALALTNTTGYTQVGYFISHWSHLQFADILSPPDQLGKQVRP
jgi:hypothetical protein